MTSVGWCGPALRTIPTIGVRVSCDPLLPLLRTVIGYGVPSSRIRGEGPWACDGGIRVGRGPRRGWRALPGAALQRQIRAALRLLLLLHPLLSARPRVRAVLKALARAHHVADAGGYHRVMGRGGRVMGAVRARGRGHVRRRTRQGRAGPAAAALVSAAPTASARLAVLHQHRHRDPSRRTRALKQSAISRTLVIGYFYKCLIDIENKKSRIKKYK